MKALALLFVCAALAEDEPLEITKDAALSIQHCHAGDKAVIHVVPIPINARRAEGWMITTNAVLGLPELSMLPEGLIRLEIQTVCRGLTGEVGRVVIDLRRPPPPPAVSRVGVQKPSAVPLRFGAVPAPPLPPGLALALPGAETNRMSYEDAQLMRRYYSKTGRRSQ